MAIKYLLDTNILSEPVRKSPNPFVVERIENAEDTVAIATTSWHELLFRVLRMTESRKRIALEQYLTMLRTEVPILPYDTRAATWFAQERARLSREGLPPSYPDGQMAAVAAVNDLILVTRNVADFAKFSDMEIENWFE
ncbi:type II toxin-antitoxin system VapC family toxin [Candidatus Leptofilum sp.]|uniref:type II toxin-antitoxin system VapC family toxin n=1 Tax=Candidatus Leptofilum sp. TaxID=3241576 RepID=UPI003B591ED0